MLKWSMVFIVMSSIVAILRLGNIVGVTTAEVFEIVFYIFIVLYLVTLLIDSFRRRQLK